MALEQKLKMEKKKYVRWPKLQKKVLLKLRHYKKATKFEEISHLFWQNSCFYSVASKQVGDFFKFLLSPQKSWTLCWKKISVARHKQMKKLEAAQLGKLASA